MGSLKKSSRRKSKKHQKLYKMKGCSKRSRKNHLGGSSGDINLAYPSNNVKTQPNPFLAYSGKGGSTCNSISSPNLAPTNTNGSNPEINRRRFFSCSKKGNLTISALMALSRIEINISEPM